VLNTNTDMLLVPRGGFQNLTDIVRDLAELYGGTISLEESAMGGVRAELRVPGC